MAIQPFEPFDVRLLIKPISMPPKLVYIISFHPTNRRSTELTPKPEAAVRLARL